MQEPVNEAAQLIVAAQSVLKDLNEQTNELQAAKDRQTSLIESLTPVAEWRIVEDSEAN